MYVDISSNNGLVAFQQLAPAVEGVIVRVTMGFNTQDKIAQTNAHGASAAGIPLSYYHFAYPHSVQDVVGDAKVQADYFLGVIKNLPGYQDLIIDLEPWDSTGKDTALNPLEFSSWLQTFLDEVEAATGKKMVIYSYADYLNTHLPEGHTFGSYNLWIANYNDIPSPTLPKGWDTWYMWQYSEKGKVPGIKTNVDLSKKNVTT